MASKEIIYGSERSRASKLGSLTTRIIMSKANGRKKLVVIEAIYGRQPILWDPSLPKRSSGSWLVVNGKVLQQRTANLIYRSKPAAAYISWRFVPFPHPFKVLCFLHFDVHKSISPIVKLGRLIQGREFTRAAGKIVPPIDRVWSTV